MPITIVSKTFNEDTSLTNSFATSPISTTTGRLYILCVSVVNYPEYLGSDIVSISTSGGVTWTKAASLPYYGTYPTEVWYGYCAAGAGSVSWTVTTGTTPSSSASRQYIINEVAGTTATGIVVQSNTAESTTATVVASLSGFSQTSNACFVYGIVSATSPPSITVEAGYNQVTATDSSIYSLFGKTAYRIGEDTTPSFTLGGDSPISLIIALELLSLDSGGAPNTLMLMGCGR